MHLRSFFPAVVAMLMLPATNLQASEQIEVEIVRDGKRQYLSQETQLRIADRLTKVFATCSLNSRDHPQVFASWGLETIWEETLAKDHLTVRFSKPVGFRAVNSAVIFAQELLLGLSDPRFPGPELTRYEQHTLAYVKCLGYDEIRFVCAPGIKHVMPRPYHQLCRYAAEFGQDGAEAP